MANENGTKDTLFKVLLSAGVTILLIAFGLLWNCKLNKETFNMYDRYTTEKLTAIETNLENIEVKVDYIIQKNGWVAKIDNTEKDKKEGDL